MENFQQFLDNLDRGSIKLNEYKEYKKYKGD